jgi:23S rRNA (pseudouridine1915-N3)-methyltransferase
VKLHIITVGKPRLTYAKNGWDEYVTRLKRLHDVRITHLNDKHADDATKFLAAVDTRSYSVALVIGAPQLSSHGLADLLRQQELASSEMTWFIGGPDGLPGEVIAAADLQLGLSELTFPHDLAMVVLAETLYRASTINQGTPYHH